MIYTSLKNNIYYDSNADVLNYKIVEDDGAVIYFGTSIKNPKSGLNRINVGEIIRDYLTNNLEEGWPALSGSSISQTESYKKFSLISGELVMETYGVIFNWIDLFDGSDMVLSEPINGKMEPRMKFFWTRFGADEAIIPIDGYYIILDGDTSFDYEQQIASLRVVDCFNWEDTIVEKEGNWFTIVKTETGITLNIDYNSTDTNLYGSLRFYYNEREYEELQLVQYGNLMQCFTIKAYESGTIRFTIPEYGGGLRFYGLQYKKNDDEWTVLNIDSQTLTGTVSVSSGDTVLWKSSQNNRHQGLQQGNFNCDFYFDVYGNVMSLICRADRNFYELTDLNGAYIRGMLSYNTKLLNSQFLVLPATTGFGLEAYAYLFNGCTSMETAPKRLPAENVSGFNAYGVYQYMFEDCTSLKTAPVIGAKVFLKNLLSGMFKGCTSLETAPELPATSVTEYCYYGIFSGCTSLKNAPSLQATKLAKGCYSNMFEGCTSLETAPNLPATSLSGNCYESMFRNCTSLVNAPSLQATKLAKGCYSNMFEGCTSLETAPELPATSVTEYCYSNMFNGCTSLVTAPVIKATKLSGGCFYKMFAGCTKLKNAPVLNVTILANSCYREMFRGCTSLVTAPELPAAFIAVICYREMFRDCTSLVNAPNLPATAAYYDCYMGMFQNCTSLVNAPIISASTVEQSSFEDMFKGCTSLTAAPVLKPTTLTQQCYKHMFYGCSALSYVKCLAENNINENGSTDYWLYGVNATGTFVKKRGVIWPLGVRGIPNGWRVQEADN